jgi:hypothetical protein
MDDGGWVDFKFKLKKECKPWILQTALSFIFESPSTVDGWMMVGGLTSSSN